MGSGVCTSRQGDVCAGGPSGGNGRLAGPPHLANGVIPAEVACQGRNEEQITSSRTPTITFSKDVSPNDRKNGVPGSDNGNTRGNAPLSGYPSPLLVGSVANELTPELSTMMPRFLNTESFEISGRVRRGSNDGSVTASRSFCFDGAPSRPRSQRGPVFLADGVHVQSEMHPLTDVDRPKKIHSFRGATVCVPLVDDHLEQTFDLLSVGGNGGRSHGDMNASRSTGSTIYGACANSPRHRHGRSHGDMNASRSTGSTIYGACANSPRQRHGRSHGDMNASRSTGSTIYGACANSPFHRHGRNHGDCSVSTWLDSMTTIKGAKATLKRHVQQGKPLSLRSSLRDGGASMGFSFRDDVQLAGPPSVLSNHEAHTPGAESSPRGDYSSFRRGYESPVFPLSGTASFSILNTGCGNSRKPVRVTHVSGLLELVETPMVSAHGGYPCRDIADDASRQQSRRVANNVERSPGSKEPPRHRQGLRNRRVVLQEYSDNPDTQLKGGDLGVCGNDDYNQSYSAAPVQTTPSVAVTKDHTSENGDKEDFTGGWSGIGANVGASSDDWYARMRKKMLSDGSDDGPGEAAEKVNGEAAEQTQC
uniref:Uncharacterized protein n=1 Tax=Trypanosoma congolense (strain IL3000) TaxID=1068625 RepID=G0UYN9_TRYCI|nr:conserved hypothetical protein [Trypanosoma congolense IL3000]